MRALKVVGRRKAPRKKVVLDVAPGPDGNVSDLQHVPIGVNRDSQGAPQERV